MVMQGIVAGGTNGRQSPTPRNTYSQGTAYSKHILQSTSIPHRLSTITHVYLVMEEEQSNTFTRPYRSKRSRPCDICRGRKGYCRIEDAPPCQRCRKLNVACTFIEGPAKRQQTSYREDDTTTDQRAHFQGQASGSDTGLQSGSNGQPLPPSYPLAVTQDTQLFTQHDVLQDSSGSRFDTQQNC